MILYDEKIVIQNKLFKYIVYKNILYKANLIINVNHICKKQLFF